MTVREGIVVRHDQPTGKPRGRPRRTVSAEGFEPISDLRYRIGRLRVTCWCEARTFWVPAAEIAAGITASCGRVECHAPS